MTSNWTKLLSLVLMVVFGFGIADYIPAETMISIDGAEMILVPTGEFKMGTSEAEIDLLIRDFAGKGAKRSWFEAETPQHVVYTDKFYIDVTEVTNRMYAKFLNDRTQNADEFGHQLLDLNSDHVLIGFVDGRYRPKGGFENHPVIEVTWYGAAAYCRWVGKQLPTEAQWEKAARGGLVGGRYPWGDQFSSDNVNYGDPQGIDGWGRTAPVASYPMNGYGLYDMAGNVMEWCMDEYDPYFYVKDQKDNPVAGDLISFENSQSANVETQRVIRGGSWNNDNFLYLRVADRGGMNSAFSSYYIGFRCVLSSQFPSNAEFEGYRNKVGQLGLSTDNLSQAENLLARSYSEEKLTELETEWVGYVKDVADGKINLKMYRRLQFALASEVSIDPKSNVKLEETTPSVSGKPKGGQAQQQIEIKIDSLNSPELENQIEIAKGRILTTVKSLSKLNLKNKLGVEPPHPKTKKQKIVRDNSVNSNVELSARKEENRMKKDTVSPGKKVTSPDPGAGKPTKSGYLLDTNTLYLQHFDRVSGTNKEAKFGHYSHSSKNTPIVVNCRSISLVDAQEYTIEFWWYAPKYMRDGILIKTDDTESNWKIAINNFDRQRRRSNIIWTVGNREFGLSREIPWRPNRWYHLALTGSFKTGKHQLYINANVVGTVEGISDLRGWVTGSLSITNEIGYLDEVRISNVVRKFDLSELYLRK